mmetsp:Transcript_60542/g.100047  ORF Transcript_60542/g.100047 Transcript_60542/m.100047 type:complete len:156 (-) Transcript_60542:286-753(-)
MAGQNKGGFNIPPPDRAELDANVKKIRSRIDDLQQKLEELNERDNRENNTDKFRDERKQIQQCLDSMRTDIDQHKERQKQLRSRINEIDETKTDLRKKNQDKNKNTPTTVKEIDERVRTRSACGREPWRKVGFFVVEAPVQRSLVDNSCTADSLR